MDKSVALWVSKGLPCATVPVARLYKGPRVKDYGVKLIKFCFSLGDISVLFVTSNPRMSVSSSKGVCKPLDTRWPVGS